MDHKLFRLFVLAVGVLLSKEAYVSQLNPLTIEDLLNRSSHIVVGFVVKSEDRRTDTPIKGLEEKRIQIKAVSYLRGDGPKLFSVDLDIGGLKGFDRDLPERTSGVFFLNKLEGTQGTLSYHSSVAELPFGYFYGEGSKR